MPMPHYSVAAETAWLLALFGARQPDGHPLLRCSRGWASIATSRSTDANDVGYGDTGQVVTGTNEGKSGVVRDVHLGNSGQVMSTVVRQDGECCNTLARSVVRVADAQAQATSDRATP